MLFEQAVLAEGGQLDNPADFVNRINKLLVSSASLIGRGVYSI